jgi:hypothetical protein
VLAARPHVPTAIEAMRASLALLHTAPRTTAGSPHGR